MIAVALVTVLGFVADVRAAAAQQPVPELDIVLVLEITDGPAWVALHEELMGVSSPTAAPLEVSVAAATGGRRAIMVGQPRVDVAMIRGLAGFKVTVYGKLALNEALVTLGPFEQAVFEKQTAVGDSELGLQYVLSSVTVRLLEMQVTRPPR